MANISSDNKRIAKNTFYLYVRMFINLIISLYTSRAILAALGVDDFGIFNVVAGFIALLGVFSASLVEAARRFLTYELGKGNNHKLKDTIATFNGLFMLLAIIFILLGIAFGNYIIKDILVIPPDRIGAALFVFYCSLGVFSVQMMTITYIACVTSHEHMNFYAFVSIGESVYKLLIVYLLYITSFDNLKTYAFLLLLVSITVFIIYVLYCSKNFEESKYHLKLHKSILKEVLTFSLWVSYGSAAVVIKEQGVNILINVFFSVAMNAARAISTQVSSVFNQFASSIATAVNPQITKSYASGDVERSMNLTIFLARAQGTLITIIAIPLYCEMDFVLKIWLGNVPDYATTFCRWVLIYCVARSIRNAYEALYLATGKVRNLELIGGTIVLLNFPVCYIALRMGMPAIVTMQINVIIEFLYLLVCYSYLYHIMNFPLRRFFIDVVGKLSLVIIASMILPVIIHYYMAEESILRFVMSVLSCLLVALRTASLLVLSKNEKTMLVNFLKAKIKTEK